MELYGKMTAIERYICRVLAVVCIPMPLTIINSLLNELGSRWVPRANKWDSKFLRELLDKLASSGMLGITSHSVSDQWFCNRLVLELLARESARSGEFEGVIKAAYKVNGNKFGHAFNSHEYSFDNKFHLSRELRRAIYKREYKRARLLLENGRYMTNPEMESAVYGREVNYPLLFEILFNPPHEGLILNLPENLLAHVLHMSRY